MYIKIFVYLCSRKGFMKELPTYTPDFEEYIRHGEPDKKERAQIWRTAIGLQQVDGLEVSEYFKESVKRNIEGEISIDEVQKLTKAYYVSKTNRAQDDDEKEEADKVAGNISKILASQTLDFSTNGYISLHRRIFNGVFKHAGEIRTYNITKIAERPREKTIGKPVGKTAGKIVELMRNNPQITIPEIAAAVQTSESNVLQHSSKLQKQGIIRRVDGRKEGYWQVID